MPQITVNIKSWDQLRTFIMIFECTNILINMHQALNQLHTFLLKIFKNFGILERLYLQLVENYVLKSA